MVRCSIVTAYYKNEELTIEFLDNLVGKIGAEDEVILVNAGSGAVDHYVVSTRIDLEKNESFSNSMNAGIKAAKGDFVVVIGNDGFPTNKNWLDELIKTQQVTGASIVVPTPTKPNVSAYDRLLVGSVEGFPEYKMFPAICYLLPRSTIESVGYFDERFLGGCYEDDDYCLRVRNSGGVIVRHPAVFVRHLLSQTVKLLDGNKLMRENYKRFKEKWGDKAP